jgi:methylated-DNA-[protein]-cysteine S-methyltransferase
LDDRVSHTARLRTPFAVLGIESDGRAVTRVTYLPLTERAQAPQDEVTERAAREVERYLADPEFRFTVPLSPGGTPFQQRVWHALAAIPPGQSRTYGEVARMLRSAPRAIGQACGANRIALIVPCHRVVGAMGSMGGFMGSEEGDPIAIKRWLLTHEGYRFGK